MEKKKQELTEREKREIREVIERYYGVSLGPDTPEDKERLNMVLRLWQEAREKRKPSSEAENGGMPIE